MHIVVYITASDQEEARRIARHLLELGLIACANILPAHSIYHWQGQIEESAECICVCKTRKACFEPLRKAVLEIHSYTTPCIVAWPLVAGDANFLAWIDAHTNTE